MRNSNAYQHSHEGTVAQHAKHPIKSAFILFVISCGWPPLVHSLDSVADVIQVNREL